MNNQELENIRNNILTALNSPNGKEKNKDLIRMLHDTQRIERAKLQNGILSKYGNKIISYFADGKEVDPEKIDPELVLVKKSLKLKRLESKYI